MKFHDKLQNFQDAKSRNFLVHQPRQLDVFRILVLFIYGTDQQQELNVDLDINQSNGYNLRRDDRKNSFWIYHIS